MDGKTIVHLILVTSVLVILVSGEKTNKSSSSIINSIGGTGSKLIAAIQGRSTSQGIDGLG